MKTFDTLTNLVANLGAGNAKTLADSFGMRSISDQELEAMYRGDWISRKIVDLPVTDMLRPWRAWQAENEQIEGIEDAERRHKVRQKLALAKAWGRLYGGAGMLIGADTSSPDKELRVESIKQGGLRYLTVLPRRMLQVHDMDYDPESPFFGEPQYYSLYTRAGTSIRIHPSRVLRFIGVPRPDIDLNPDGWGDSVLQVVYDAIHHAGLTSGAIAELVHEAKVDVIRMHELGDKLATSDGTSLVTKRFQAANMLKSINNMLLLDKEDEWDRKQTSFQGLSDVLVNYLQIVAGAADIPATRLLGTAPKGMNATGDSDIRNYYDMLDGQREDTLRPKLEFLDEILWRDAIGMVPKDAYFTFNPLWQMTAKEKADLAKTKAETTQIYANSGLIPDEPLAHGVTNMLIEDETYPGLEAEIEKYLASGGPLVPEEEEVDPDADVQPSEDDPEGDTEAVDRIAPHRSLTGPGYGSARHSELARQIGDELDARKRRAGYQRRAGGFPRRGA